MVSSLQLQLYQHNYGLVCMTGLLGCRWHRYKQSTQPNRKVLYFLMPNFNRNSICSALDKLLGQLGIHATWLSSFAYLQKQLRIFYIFYATFLAVITYVFLLNEAIANVPTYLLSSSAFLSIKLADFIVREANLIALLTLVARIHFAKFFC